MIKREQIEKYFNEIITDEETGEERDNPDFIDCDLLADSADSTMEGLNIIFNRLKESDKKNKTVLVAAEHDIVYSINIDEALEILEEEDFKTLARLNWMIDEDTDSLASFV